MSRKCSSPGCVAWAFEAGLCKSHFSTSKPDKPAVQLNLATVPVVPRPVAGGGAAKSLAPHAPPAHPSPSPAPLLPPRPNSVSTRTIHIDKTDGTMAAAAPEPTSNEHDSPERLRSPSPTASETPSDSETSHQSDAEGEEQDDGAPPEEEDDGVPLEHFSTSSFTSTPSDKFGPKSALYFQDDPSDSPLNPENSIRWSSLERNLWLKACLVLETCTKGVWPFVGMVMKRVHSRANQNVKQDIARDFNACEDEDWDCDTVKEAAESTFTENGPVALSVHLMDPNGIASCASAHNLKPRVLKPCRVMGIPLGCFSDADKISPTSPVLIYSNPAEGEKTESSSFILLHGMKPTRDDPFLTPFLVTRCEPSRPALNFHAVLCSSRRGYTKQLVKSSSSQTQPPKIHGELTFGFWAVVIQKTALGSEFSELKHGAKRGNILCFDGGESNCLPPGIVKGRRYLVTDVTDFSFNICGPIISPISSLTSPFDVIRKAPVGR
jgi:hypothetical protein